MKISVFSAFLFLSFLCVRFSSAKVASALAVILHEAGHIVALRAAGGRVVRITVFPFGADMETEGGQNTVRGEFFSVLGGILANLLTAVLSFCCLRFFPGYGGFFRELALCSLLYAVLNALPVKTLDGGRLLHLLLLQKNGVGLSFRAERAISFVFLFCLWFVGVYLLFYTAFNVSLFLMCVYLFYVIFGRDPVG